MDRGVRPSTVAGSRPVSPLRSGKDRVGRVIRGPNGVENIEQPSTVITRPRLEAK